MSRSDRFRASLTIVLAGGVAVFSVGCCSSMAGPTAPAESYSATLAPGEVRFYDAAIPSSTTQINLDFTLDSATVPLRLRQVDPSCVPSEGDVCQSFYEATTPPRPPAIFRFGNTLQPNGTQTRIVLQNMSPTESVTYTHHAASGRMYVAFDPVSSATAFAQTLRRARRSLCRRRSDGCPHCRKFGRRRLAGRNHAQIRTDFTGTDTALPSARRSSMKRFILAAVIGLLFAFALVARGEEPAQSAAPAATVKALLEQLKMDAIAARDPEEPGRYIAAFYVPDSQQLLVVSAPYSVPAALDRVIAAGNYMEAYMNLQAVKDHKGHFFVVDSLADGLRNVPAVDQPFDSTTIDGAVMVMFDGKWDAQKLTESGYNAMFAKDDAKYARMLTILASELRKKTTAQ